MRKFFAVLVSVMLLIFAPTAAFAGGSDSPTPYQVTTEGVNLPPGDTFKAHGHVNVRYFDSSGVQRSAGMHFDPNNGHPGGQWIGQSFIPWSAFGITEGRIIWVQVHGYNQHFGEGGQKPIPVGPKPSPNEETRETTETEFRETRQCPSDDTGYGTVTTTKVTVHVTEHRASTITWDGTDWVETWGEWVETSRMDGASEVVEVREMSDAEYGACGLPPTGAPLMLAIGGAVVLLAGGALLLVSRNRRQTV